MTYVAGVGRIAGAVVAGVMLSSTGLMVTALDKAFNIGKYQLVVAGVLLTLTAIKQPDGIAASPPPPLVKLRATWRRRGAARGAAAAAPSGAAPRRRRPAVAAMTVAARPRRPVGGRPRRGAAAFYGRAFGFEPEFAFELPDGIRGAMLRLPSGRAAGALRAPGLRRRARRRSRRIAALATRGYGHFAVSAPDIDAVYGAALDAGAVGTGLAAAVARAGRALRVRRRPGGQPRRARGAPVRIREAILEATGISARPAIGGARP